MTFNYDEEGKKLTVYKDDGTIAKFLFQEWQMGELFKLILETIATIAPAEVAEENGDEEGEESVEEGDEE